MGIEPTNYRTDMSDKHKLATGMEPVKSMRVGAKWGLTSAGQGKS